MKRALALLALCISACGESPTDPPKPVSELPPVGGGPPVGGAPPVGGEWGLRAELIEANSEAPLVELNGKLYILGGYPKTRVTVRTVIVYDIASDSWSFGPQLPQLNNHGMGAAVNGKIYLIGGQTTADYPLDNPTYVNTVYELDPAVGSWVQKASMPTARSGGVAVVHGGRIYVAGGRPPRGSDFAAYDPATNSWEVLPNMPSQRNHIVGAAIDGRIHIAGGRLWHGLSPEKTTVHEVYDPQARTWSEATPLLQARSGMNSVVARGCYHVWGGEDVTGMTPNHEYYDPRTGKWTRIADMPIPVHGITGSAYVGGLIWVTGGGTAPGGAFASSYNQVFKPTVSCE